MVFYHGSPDRLRQSFFFLAFCVPSLHHNLGATEVRTTSLPSSHSMKPPVIFSGFRIGGEQLSCLGDTDFRGLSRKKLAVLAVSSSGREDRASKLTRLKKNVNHFCNWQGVGSGVARTVRQETSAQKWKTLVEATQVFVHRTRDK